MKYTGRIDALSIGISFICLIHCIILPLFLTSLPFLGLEILDNIYLESLTIVLSFIIGGYAIKKGYTNFHKNGFIVFLFATGITLMLISNFLPHSTEIGLKLTGGFIIAISHIQNFKLSQKSLLFQNKTMVPDL